MLVIVRLLLITLFILSCSRLAIAQATQPRSSVTPLTVAATMACSAAYVDGGKVIGSVPVTQLHINQSSAADLERFRRYDAACFRGLNQASDVHTVPFVRRIIGVIGQVNQSEYMPICTILRTSAQTAVAPLHCLCDYRRSSLKTALIARFMTDPELNVTVIGPPTDNIGPVCSNLNDFGDAVTLTLDKSAPKSSLDDKDYVGYLSAGMQLALVGFDAFRYLENSPDMSGKWVNSLVFSPTSGSRKYASEWISPQPTNGQFDSCIYYAAPTYPGMSGGLILGIEPNNGGRLFVAGMHIRPARSQSDAGCGNHLGVQGEVLNLGLAWPTVAAIVSGASR